MFSARVAVVTAGTTVEPHIADTIAAQGAPVVLRAHVAVVARGPFGFERIGSNAGEWITRSDRMALVQRSTHDGRADAYSRLARVELRAGVAVVA